MDKKLRLWALIFLLSVSFPMTYAQEYVQDTVKKTKVYLEHCDVQSYNKNIDDQRKVLTGNVIFRHDSSFMYCDSAYFFEQDKTLEAFGAVRMEQGDTLFIYGDYLHYDGRIELAKMRNNVRMVNVRDTSQVTLYTDSLDYDRVANLGYFFEWGRIIDAENELVSLYGQYSPATKIAVFNDSVLLTNPNFTLHSDTLEYSTETKIATILGPSVIESDSGIIHSSRGWYDTENNTSLLLDRSVVLSGNKFLSGDTLAYDRVAGIGEAFGNVIIRDTVQKVILLGNYGYCEEKTEFAFVTDSASAIEYSQGDSLYLHADTLLLVTVDSTSRYLRAFMGARFYRSDIQGVSDSMRFSTKDSVLYMYENSVLWNEDQQLFGDSIHIYMSDSAVKYVHVPTSAFVAQMVDTGYFNQLGGNDLKAYFEGKNIRQIDIDGNAESIFYPMERDSAMIGQNSTQSSYLTMWISGNKLEKLKIWPQPTGKMIPIPLLTPEEKKLKKFAWYEDLRPVNKDDIFRKTNK